MSALRFSSLIILFPILFAACGRSELIRIRMLAPVNEDKKDYAIFTDTKSSSTPVIINNKMALVYIFCLKASAWATPLLQPKWKKQTKISQRKQHS